MHLVLGVPVHLDPLGRPVLDVASAVNHREIVTCKQTDTFIKHFGKSEKMHVVLATVDLLSQLTKHC